MGQKFFDMHESSRLNMSFKCSGAFNIIYIMRTSAPVRGFRGFAKVIHHQKRKTRQNDSERVLVICRFLCPVTINIDTRSSGFMAPVRKNFYVPDPFTNPRPPRTPPTGDTHPEIFRLTVSSSSRRRTTDTKKPGI
ncbi:hypothetical protein DVF23_06535 [Salmonella enterica subsp. enterica serovar Teko]|nr:hypothetical protein [Salmonella enterica subsp. enterica serovar Teko]